MRKCVQHSKQGTMPEILRCVFKKREEASLHKISHLSQHIKEAFCNSSPWLTLMVEIARALHFTCKDASQSKLFFRRGRLPAHTFAALAVTAGSQTRPARAGAIAMLASRQVGKPPRPPTPGEIPPFFFFVLLPFLSLLHPASGSGVCMHTESSHWRRHESAPVPRMCTMR